MTKSRGINRTRGKTMTPKRARTWQLLAHGLSNPQIAEAVGSALGTVKCHVDDVFEILGVTNRVQAALRWHGIEVKPERLL